MWVNVDQTENRNFGERARRLGRCATSALAPFVFCLFLQLLSVPEGFGQVSQPPGLVSSSSPLIFNIPSEPLSDALDAYSALTGIEVFSANGLLAGKTSTAVEGHYTPTAALSRLMKKTGLLPRYIDGHSFTLMPTSQGGVPQSDSVPGDPGNFRAYAALLQLALNQALCAAGGGGMTGTQRLIIEMWVNASGTIQHPVLLEGTGDAGRDTALLGLIDGVDVGVPPPVNLPQPATILIIPSTDSCQAGAQGETPP